MSKILITTFPKDFSSITALGMDGPQDEVKFQIGFDEIGKSQEIKQSALSSLFISLIIHDEIYLTVGDLIEVINSIGIRDTLSLLDRKILKVINRTEEVALLEGKKTQGKIKLTSVTGELDAFARYERAVNSEALIPQNEKATLIQFTHNAKIELSKDLYQIGRLEVARDLTNKTFQHLGISSQDASDVNKVDSLKVLRIANITEQLIIQNHLEIDSIAQDGFGKEYLNSKLGALSVLASKDSLLPFENISKLKGIPDLYTLYKAGAITLQNILECRNTFSGGLFRQWYSSTDYNEAKILQVLLNRSGKETATWKFSRLVYPSIIGLIGPVSGFVASAIDSYIVGKILNGWNPSLFLDDVFKRKIDSHIAKNDLNEKKAEILRRFGKIERNALCPCQSGVKYKKCHGKII